MDFRLFSEAQTEIDESAAYYDQQCQGLGRRFVDETYAAIQLAVEMPSIGVKVHKRTRRVLLKHFPYAVVYLPLDNHIVIVAVMHCRRRPHYWKKRIRFI